MMVRDRSLAEAPDHLLHSALFPLAIECVCSPGRRARILLIRDPVLLDSPLVPAAIAERPRPVPITQQMNRKEVSARTELQVAIVQVAIVQVASTAGCGRWT
jgi:hypothetical protein